MRISVVIPTWNEAPRIADTIEQTRLAGDCEIIVVDGGSPDGTRDCASRADRVLVSPPGRARQQNAGAREATGSLLLFLHADCRLEPGSLNRLRETVRDAPTDWGCFRQVIDHPRALYRVLERGNELRVRLLSWVYGDQSLFVSRELFDAVGGFPEVELMEDLYLSKRLKRIQPARIVTSACVHVSARRWEQRGPWRQTLSNWLFIVLAHCGFPLSRLARWYRHIR